MQTSIHISPEMDAKLERLALQSGRSKSWFLEQAIERVLDEDERAVHAIKEGIAEADAGEFASDDEVRSAFGRWGVTCEGSLD
ncbi:MAG: ribbon-helix-helix protein, CopG family [Acidobacteriota bacterium]|nr:ribbon-helix-helix protein, CopG family [Acidobacteriota bacterium]